MKYTAVPERYSRYIITDELQNQIGTIDYSGWRPSSARIHAADHRIYDLKTVGFWQQTIEVLRDGVPYATLKLTMGMGLRISITFDNGKSFYIKQKQVFNRKEVVLDDEDNEVGIVDSYYRWRKWAFGYELDLKIRPVHTDMEVSLPLLILYACRLIRQRRGAA